MEDRCSKKKNRREREKKGEKIIKNYKKMYKKGETKKGQIVF